MPAALCVPMLYVWGDELAIVMLLLKESVSRCSIQEIWSCHSKGRHTPDVYTCDKFWGHALTWRWWTASRDIARKKSFLCNAKDKNARMQKGSALSRLKSWLGFFSGRFCFAYLMWHSHAPKLLKWSGTKETLRVVVCKRVRVAARSAGTTSNFLTH